jgi:hypothetical protein
MFRSRSTMIIAVAAAVVFTLPVLGAGCGSGPTDFDKAANYTPEALAQELILRYRALNPTQQTSAARPRKKKAGAGAPRAPISKKSTTRATKKSGPATIDDVLDDIEYKITLVKETSHDETTKKMIETILGDNSLPAADKKTLTDLVGRLAD